jgi:hypothetical protein
VSSELSPDPEVTGEAMFHLDGKIALVTGASSGLGMRFAKVLAASGATVVVAARRQMLLEELAQQIGGVAVPTDLKSTRDREALIDQVRQRFGRLDILVNNAGISRIAPAEQEELDAFREVVELNLIAQFALTQLAARIMLATGSGSIINIASISALVGVGQLPQAAYAASKGALVSMTRELAAQWARRGVRVNALAPGWFPTELTQEFFRDERSLAWLHRRVPMGRAGSASELDGALLFLASDASSYVTGQVIAIDGGFTSV